MASKNNNYQFLESTRNIYNACVMANQGVKRSHQEIMNTPHFTNPFYKDYNDLIDLSKKIVENQSLDFSNKDKSSAFLFDVSMLFEYFIRKLIKKSGIKLLGKFDKQLTIPTASAEYKRKLQPDLVFDCEDGRYVFDVKYKYFDFKYGVKREDLFQLHTYIGQHGNGEIIKGCGFIYPIVESKWNELPEESKNSLSSTITQQGKEIPFHVFFLKIPDNNSEFNKNMMDKCNCFIENLKSMLEMQ